MSEFFRFFVRRAKILQKRSKIKTFSLIFHEFVFSFEVYTNFVRSVDKQSGLLARIWPWTLDNCYKAGACAPTIAKLRESIIIKLILWYKVSALSSELWDQVYMFIHKIFSHDMKRRLLSLWSADISEKSLIN